MNTRLITSIVFASLIALTGCSSDPTRQQMGTAAGAVVGGVVGNAVLGGPLGTLIPPSGALIVFGIIAEQSIGKLVAGTMMQEIAAFALDLQGPAGILTDKAESPA